MIVCFDLQSHLWENNKEVCDSCANCAKLDEDEGYRPCKYDDNQCHWVEIEDEVWQPSKYEEIDTEY